MLTAFILAAAVAAVPPAFASASIAAPATAVATIDCPIGGKPFRFSQVAAPAPIGERPDGKPYGRIKFPRAMPECPDNGLVLYKEYEAEEVAKLEPLVASEAYQALRKSDTQYYRAYWLMREMGVAPERYLSALLQAGWEADDRPELRKRYLEELVDATAKLPERPSDLNWLGMEARAVNALRELGRFDEASARLGKIPLKNLQASSAAETELGRARRPWVALLANLTAAVERKDSSLEPLDMLPKIVALGHCIDQAASLTEAGRAFCEKESAGIEALKAQRARIAGQPAR
jgi:hypothetical protein